MLENAPQKPSVAIIGSGQAGMFCSNRLNQSGFAVTVFDSFQEYGGIMAFGVPEFRISLQSVREKIDALRKVGVAFERKEIRSVKQLLKKFGGSFDYVIVATGGGVSAKAGFEGEDGPNVLDAITFLKCDKIDKKHLLSKDDVVAVIGGGYAALDAASVAIRQCGKTTLLYRRTEAEISINERDREGLKKDGVKMEYLVAPRKFTVVDGKGVLECDEMVLGEPDATGRHKPSPSGKTKNFEVTKVIIAVGQTPDFSWLESEGIATDGKKIKIDVFGKTTLDNVYACGDCVTGPSSFGVAIKSSLPVTSAIAAQKKA